MHIDPEQMEEVRAITRDLREETLKEPGLILMNVFEDMDRPDLLLIVEEWKTQEDYTGHITSPHFIVYGEKMQGKCSDTLIHRVKFME